MSTAAEMPPNHGSQPAIPNQRVLRSADEQQRWNRIIGNVNTGNADLATWSDIADKYPQPEWLALNRRVPHVNTDMPMVDPDENSRPVTALPDVTLNRIRRGLQAL
jgi:hypothetical protein